MKMVFIGDSITGYSDLSHYLKFSHIIESMCEAKFCPGKIAVLNRGKGGDSTVALLERFEADVLAEKPDIAVMLIGGNDAGQKLPRATTEANLDRLLTQLRTVCPKILLLQYHLLPHAEAPEKAWKHLPSNNDLIAAAAQKHGCPLLDMSQPMTAAVDDSVPVTETDFRRFPEWRGLSRYRTCELVAIDGVHLNSAGEIVFAKTIFAELIRLNWLNP